MEFAQVFINEKARWAEKRKMMQIGDVIKKYRKEMNLTQEEMAKRLGVTAPAVNKWENGNSFPDITLLVPIARLLNINMDTLLSFQENLSDEEINRLVEETKSRLKTEAYAEVFDWAKKKIKTYPNSKQLILWMAQVLGAYLEMKDVADAEKYEEKIKDYYVRALESDDGDIKNEAAEALFYYYFNRKEYEAAEQYLSYFSKENPERKRKQAMIYGRTNRKEEAYKAYEELLFLGYQSLSQTFQYLFALAMEENNLEKAQLLAKKQELLAEVFDMGDYLQASGKLELATIKKDVEETLQIVTKMASGLKEITAFRKSALFEHMTFRNVSEELQEEMKEHFMELLHDEETFSYMKGNAQWEELISCEK